jgi:hypothetical protein
MPQQDQYLWSVSELKWIKSPADCTTVRLTAAGQAYLGPCRLHWIIANPSGANAVLDITDDADGLGAIKLDAFLTAKETRMLALAPGMRFAVGIYLKTFTNLTSVVFGYTPPL